MVNTNGVRSGTRYLFARDHKKHGPLPTSTYLTVYKVGDYVNIKACGAQQKGMPHKYYHGKTGKVYNVTKRALGIIVNKRVRARIVPKKINVRIEHIKQSKCREDFVRRVKRNDRLRRAARAKGIHVQLKRQPKGPETAHFVRAKDNAPQDVAPIPYQFVC